MWAVDADRLEGAPRLALEGGRIVVAGVARLFAAPPARDRRRRGGSCSTRSPRRACRRSRSRRRYWSPGTSSIPRSAATRPVGRRRVAQRDAHVVLVAPGGARRDVDPPRGERLGELRPAGAASHTYGPWPGRGVERRVGQRRLQPRALGGGLRAAAPGALGAALDRPQRTGLRGRADAEDGRQRQLDALRQHRVADPEPGHRVRLGERAHVDHARVLDERVLAVGQEARRAPRRGSASASPVSGGQRRRRERRRSRSGPPGASGRSCGAPSSVLQRDRHGRRARPRSRARAAGPSRARRPRPRRRRARCSAARSSSPAPWPTTTRAGSTSCDAAIAARSGAVVRVRR